MSSDKPFDKGFKDAIERDPEGFALAFGAVPVEPGTTFSTVEREQVLPALPLDQIVRAATPSGPRLLHFESEAVYRSDVVETLLWHAVGAAYKYRTRVFSTLLIFQPEGCPRKVADERSVRLGGVTVGASYRIVRMWEDPAARLLELDRPALLTLVPFMDATPDEVIEAARRIHRTGDEGLFTWFCVYLKARYNEDVVDEIYGRFVKMVPMEIVLNSEYGKKLTARATEVALEAGMQEEARRWIRRFLSRKFPSVNAVQVDEIHGIDRLHALQDAIADAESAADVRALFDRAMRN